MSWLRWIICLIICANAISYSTNRFVLIPIQDQLMDWYNINAIQYNLLMTLYSWPNTVCCVSFGILIDKFGVRRMLAFAWFLDIIALLLIFYSCTIKHYILLCVGRTILGIGNEGLNLSLRMYAISFFKPKEYGIVFGIFCSFISVGQGANNYSAFQIYSTFGIIYTLSFPLIIAPFLFIPLFILMFVEKYHLHKQLTLESSKLITIDSDTKKEKGKFKFSDINKFSIYFWLLLLGFVMISGAAGPFMNILISFIHHMFGYRYEFATLIGLFGSFIQIASFLISGYLTSKFGRKMELLISASICAFISQYIFGWIHSHVFFVFFASFLQSVAMGCSLPIFWAAIPLVVIEQGTGTAFGFTASVRFLVTGLCYIIVGILTREKNGNQKYIDVQYFVLSLIAVSTIFYVILMYLDVKQNDSILRKVHSTKEQLSVKQCNNLLMTRMSIVSV